MSLIEEALRRRQQEGKGLPYAPTTVPPPPAAPETPNPMAPRRMAPPPHKEAKSSNLPLVIGLSVAAILVVVSALVIGLMIFMRSIDRPDPARTVATTRPAARVPSSPAPVPPRPSESGGTTTAVVAAASTPAVSMESPAPSTTNNVREAATPEPQKPPSPAPVGVEPAAVPPAPVAKPPEPWPKFSVKGILKSGDVVLVLLDNGVTLESGKPGQNGLAVAGLDGSSVRLSFGEQTRIFKRGDTPQSAASVPITP